MAKQKEESAFNLSVAERAAQRDLADAEQVRAALLTQLAEGDEVGEQLDTVDEEITMTKRKLARFAEARTAAEIASTASNRRARHEQTLDRLADGITGAEYLVELAKEALLTLAELRGRLDAIEEQRAKVVSSFGDAAQDARPGAPTERAGFEIHESLRSAINALTLPDAFLAALNEAGLGRRGVRLDGDLVAIRRALFGSRDVEEATDSALAKVRALAERVAEWSARANGAEAA